MSCIDGIGVMLLNRLSLHLIFPWHTFSLKNGIKTYIAKYVNILKDCCFICPCSETEGSTSPQRSDSSGQAQLPEEHSTSTHPAVNNSCIPALHNLLSGIVKVLYVSIDKL